MFTHNETDSVLGILSDEERGRKPGPSVEPRPLRRYDLSSGVAALSIGGTGGKENRTQAKALLGERWVTGLTNGSAQGMLSTSPPNSLHDYFHPKRHSVDIDPTLYGSPASHRRLFNETPPRSHSPLDSFNYTSSPESPLPVNFSPIHRRRRGESTDLTQSFFQSHYLSQTLLRHDSNATDHTVNTGMAPPSPSCALSSPSTSYTFSHVVHQPLTDDGAPLFLEQDSSSDDEEENYRGKGKGKAVRTRSPSPLPSPPTETHELPLIEESQGLLGLSFTQDGAIIFPDTDRDRSQDAATSLPSASPQAIPPPISRPGPRHRVGLSFSQQRFSFMTTPPRILLPLITPFPDGSTLSSPFGTRSPKTTSSDPHQAANSSPKLSRRKSVLLNLLRTKSKGKTSKGKNKGKSRSNNNRDDSSHGGEPQTPVPAGASQPSTSVANTFPELFEEPSTSTPSDELDEDDSRSSESSSSSGSATIKYSAMTMSTKTVTQASASGATRDAVVTLQEDASDTNGTQATTLENVAAGPSGGRAMRIEPLSSTLSSNVLAISAPIPLRPSSLPPPRLRFVGRANTAPATAFTQLISETAEGVSSRPSTPALASSALSPAFASVTNLSSTALVSIVREEEASTSTSSGPSHRPPIHKLTTDSVVTTVSAPESSTAFTYVHTLPPLANLRGKAEPKAKDHLRVIGGGTKNPPSGISLSNPNARMSVHTAHLSAFAEDRPPSPVRRNLFDTLLPQELRVEVFRALVRIHVSEYETLVENGQWTVGMASGTGANAPVGKNGKNSKDVHQVELVRWVGFEKGIRELVRLGRVSRAWRQLSLDGQLWSSTSFSPFPHIPIPLLLRITKTVGPFMRVLNLSGVSGISATVLMDIVQNVAVVTEGRDALAAITGLNVASDGERPRYQDMLPRSGIVVNPELKPSATQLTTINLKGCAAITSRSLHHLLIASPLVQNLTLSGLSTVTNTTCEIIGEFCSSQLVKLDLSKCWNMNANGVQGMIGHRHVSPLPDFTVLPARRLEKLRVLKLGGLRRTSESALFYIGYGIPQLEVLDLSGSKGLRDSEIAALVEWDDRYDDPAVIEWFNAGIPVSQPLLEPMEKVTLTSREMGLNPMSSEKHFKRLTHLRHISLSCCTTLTDAAAGHLAHAVPRLELLEMGNIGPLIRDAGLVRLFGTTPMIRRVDLEDASEITDVTLDALTPPPPPTPPTSASPTSRLPSPPEPGERLEHIILSYASNLSDNAFLGLTRSCTKLSVMEVDNTRASDHVVKEFVKACRKREALAAEIVAVDCRNVTRSVTSDNVTTDILNSTINGRGRLYATRNRRGLRTWDARALGYYDERDRKDPMSGLDAISGPGLGSTGDECDEARVVIKTFHTWQAVDAMVTARERRKKVLASRRANGGRAGSGTSTPSGGEGGSSSPRWLGWRSGGTPHGHPGEFDMDDERGCVIM